MPVDRLIVEGDLDAEILGAILAGRPVVNGGGSKDALPPRTRTERERTGSNVTYLRDRDFDYDPPEDRSSPVVDQEDGRSGATLGWHWCRHEIENYLLEPGIVAQAVGIPEEEYVKSVREAGERIASYQAARWAIGTARRALPPRFELRTRPEEAGSRKFFLPDDLGQQATRTWAVDHVESYGRRIAVALDGEVVSGTHDMKLATFREWVTRLESEILVWFSGKDLMVAMDDLWKGRKLDGPGAYRVKARDWVIEHPEDALSMVPEWRAFVEILRG